MKLLFCLLTLVFVFNVHAQTTFNRQVDFGEYGFPFHLFTSVLPTDSCYYVTGNISDTTDGFFAYGNIFAKFNLDGEMLFFKKVTKPDRDYFTWRGDLVPTPDGGLLDIGIVVDTVIKGVLIKYSTEGDTLFTREYFNPLYPEEDFLYAAGLKVTEDNKVKALFGFEAGSENDIYLLTLDSLGNVLDSNIYGDATHQFPQRLVLDGDGGVLIPSSKTNSHLVSKNFTSRTHLFKVDGSGEVEWEYLSPQGQLFDHAHELVKTPDGGIIVSSGKGIEHQINIESGQLRWNSYLLKLDSNQNVEWELELRGTRPSVGTGLTRLVPAIDGSGYVGTGRLAEDVSTGVELFTTWITKVSPQGDSLWARYFNFFDGYNAKPNPYDLKNTSDGGYIICGETDPSNVGDIKDGSWLMKVDSFGCLIPDCQIVGTEEAQNGSVGIAIYPNPTSDFLNFQLRCKNVNDEGVFQILSSSGDVLKTMNSGQLGDTYIVPIGDWSAGIYFLQYVDEKNNTMVSEKFIISP
jgi:hypothetical protein